MGNSTTADFRIYTEPLGIGIGTLLPNSLYLMSADGSKICIREGDDKLIRITVKDGLITFTEQL